MITKKYISILKKFDTLGLLDNNQAINVGIYIDDEDQNSELCD